MTESQRSTPSLRIVNAPDSPAAVNLEAERATLGSLLINRDAILAIRSWLEPDRFYLARHQMIYGAILACANANIPPDIRTVSEELRRRGQLESVGGLLYLTECSDVLPTSLHVEYYAQIVSDLGWQRDNQTAISRAAGRIYDQTLAPADHLAIVESLAADMRSRMRTGRQALRGRHVSELWEKQFPPIRWILEDLLPEGFTLFSGKPKMGKSLILLSLAAAVALPAGGMALGAIHCDPGDVLYLCLEDPERALQSRLESFLNGRPDIRLWYETTWDRLDAGGLADIENWLQAHPEARLVVIDTLAKVQPEQSKYKSAYQNDYDALAGLQVLAHKYNVAIIGSTHSRKPDATDVIDLVSGTSGRTGAGDNVWVLTAARAETHGELHVNLREWRSDVRALQRDEQIGGWRLGGSALEARKSRLDSEILDACSDGPMQTGDITRMIDGPEPSTRKRIQILKRQGLLELDGGRYRITEAGRAVLDAVQIEDQRDQRIAGIRGSEDQRSAILAIEAPAVLESSEIQLALEDESSDPLILRSSDPSDPLILEKQRIQEAAELEIFGPVPLNQRAALRSRLRSNVAADQTMARLRCRKYRIDYRQAWQLANETDAEPPGD